MIADIRAEEAGIPRHVAESYGLMAPRGRRPSGPPNWRTGPMRTWSRAGFPFHEAWLEIRPRRVLAWGIDTDSYTMTARDVA